ncbi:MAG TPA: Txe/YoeB family addiction module toxin [Cyclobacteriaceae bacterium]|nr:Txe/YoeB family addiction module toxin [Cyclobacteriaceae bacterium]
MTIAFTDHGWEDYRYWQTNDPETIEKINDLIKEIKREPFKGKGKPEPLRGNLKGYWSRRITNEHRLVYRVSGTKPDQTLTIIQARFHY